MRILIAEDETIIRLDLRQILEHAGFEICAETGDGEEAVRLARESEPEAAVLDVRMPGNHWNRSRTPDTRRAADPDRHADGLRRPRAR